MQLCSSITDITKTLWPWNSDHITQTDTQGPESLGDTIKRPSCEARLNPQFPRGEHGKTILGSNTQLHFVLGRQNERKTCLLLAHPVLIQRRKRKQASSLMSYRSNFHHIYKILADAREFPMYASGQSY